jgi:hypothetical protein
MKGLLGRLEDIDGISLSVIGIAEQNVTPSRHGDLFSVWQELDAKIFADGSSQFGRCPFQEFLSETSEDKWVHQQVFREDGALVDYVREQSLDILLWMLPARPAKRVLDQAKIGVWSLSNVRNEAVGFWELINAVPVTSCELHGLGSVPKKDTVLGQAFAKTDRKSLARTQRVAHALDESLVVSKMNQIVGSGEHALQSHPVEQRPASRQQRPGSIRLLYGLGRLYGRYVANLAMARFYRDQWQLAYRVGGERLSQKGLLRLAPAHKGFWADPFVIRRDGRAVIVFEELPEEKPEGRIAVIEIDDDGRAGPPRVVLERDYHLSYPFLLEFNDELFIIPESADAEKVEAFRCVSFPDKWESHAVLLDGVRAYDPTLIEHEGRWWMFVTIQHNGNTTDDELHLYYASDPFGQWVAHPANPICLDVRCARPAGALFRENDQLFRPAQDCSVRYGYALSIQRVIRMNTTEYEEETVQRILPDWAEDAQGTHTVNQAGGITVYDCIARRRK